MQKRIKPELTISVVALIVAISSTVASIYFSRMSMRTGVLPTLVLVYEVEKGWTLRNVGNGPALNVTVAHQPHDSDTWELPTRLYPIPQGETVRVRWVGNNPDRVAEAYSDVHDNEYTSITDEDLTKIYRARKLPVWTQSELRRVWEHL